MPESEPPVPNGKRQPGRVDLDRSLTFAANPADVVVVVHVSAVLVDVVGVTGLPKIGQPRAEAIAGVRGGGGLTTVPNSVSQASGPPVKFRPPTALALAM